MKTLVVIKTTFAAIHCWPECPIPEVDYLKQPHRHLFYVTVKFKVSHSDRDLEFISMKKEIDEVIKDWYADRFIESKSCEMIAEELLYHFNAVFVSVFEDNENGAEVYNEN